MHVDAATDPHDDAFRALASPVRRRVLTLVADRPRTVGELANDLGASQPATSQHLRILRDARLVVVEVDGPRRRYAADLAALRDVASFFDRYWTSNLDALRVAAEARAAGQPATRRHGAKAAS